MISGPNTGSICFTSGKTYIVSSNDFNDITIKSDDLGDPHTMGNDFLTKSFSITVPKSFEPPDIVNIMDIL